MQKSSNTKVVLMIDSLLSGGAQRQMVVLANELVRRGCAVTLLTYYPGEQLASFLDDRVRRACVERRSKYDAGFLFRLRRWLRAEQPDCLVSYLTTTNFWARIAGRLGGVPRIIISERSINIDHRRGRVLLERLLAPLSDRIVVNAEAARRQLAGYGIPVGRISVIHNGVDLALFQRAPEPDIARLREALAINADDCLVLLPGRLSREKNHLLLLRAVLDLPQPIPGLVIAFAGNEFDQKILSELRTLAQQAEPLARCLFLGPRDDMPLLYSAADVVVLPSLWEGFPNVIVEAMACETPVIVSDVADNAVIVVDHAGHVFPSDDAPALTAALVHLCGLAPEVRRAMGQHARVRAEQLCSLQTFGDRYLALIRGNEAAGA